MTLTMFRNIYYRHPELFRRQDVVDELVDDLAFTLGLGRDALNIVCAHAKMSLKVFADSIRLRMAEARSPVISGSACRTAPSLHAARRTKMLDQFPTPQVLAGSNARQGIGIPPLSRVREVALSNPCWVLVIEKEVWEYFRWLPKVSDFAGNVPNISSLAVLARIGGRTRSSSDGRCTPSSSH